MVSIVGNHDGSSAVDYTVNPATGFPWATGPRNLAVPFNHLLPAWDAITGTLAAAGVLAAERHRARTGEGQLVRVALSDVAFAMVGNLGKIAEAQVARRERSKDGNYLYGAFGRDFLTREGRRIMIVALTLVSGRAWSRRPASTRRSATLEQMMNVDLDREGDRYTAREVIAGVLKLWTVARTFDELARPSTSTASAGGPTRRSASWSPTIPAARSRTRCSSRSSSRA